MDSCKEVLERAHILPVNGGEGAIYELYIYLYMRNFSLTDSEIVV